MLLFTKGSMKVRSPAAQLSQGDRTNKYKASWIQGARQAVRCHQLTFANTQVRGSLATDRLKDKPNNDPHCCSAETPWELINTHKHRKQRGRQPAEPVVCAV